MQEAVDLHYSVSRRRVGPFEQMVHSFMEILPLAALALLAAMAWPQALLAGAALAALFNAAPLLQETWSCVRVARERVRTRTRGRPAPR